MQTQTNNQQKTVKITGTRLLTGTSICCELLNFQEGGYHRRATDLIYKIASLKVTSDYRKNIIQEFY
ncbi:hypothetical protein [Xanthocytophaga flavus]|uniref:hypothetical protein n=1 Tax=Xanthocytophaga flava TaxID=3048013 RepID=UPI0028D01E55|nr:hypothetical protein [Xanthocytophaga flavus]